jgi:carbon monoxide dehydrogenase subunit G
MASIHQEVRIAAPAAQVWSALRDVGALHTRLVTGFVTDCRMDGDARIVTFANGIVARELIVDVSEVHRRVAWAAVGGPLTHHNASAQVFDDGAGGCRVVWIADLLPHEMAPAIAGMIEQGLAAMKKTLEAAATGSAARESR